jgi:hypothetical protein
MKTGARKNIVVDLALIHAVIFINFSCQSSLEVNEFGGE